jgi:hypothetical protein
MWRRVDLPPKRRILTQTAPHPRRRRSSRDVLFCITSKPALGSNQSPIRRVLVVFAVGKSARAWPGLTTHFHPMPMSPMAGLYLHFVIVCSIILPTDNYTFYLLLTRDTIIAPCFKGAIRYCWINANSSVYCSKQTKAARSQDTKELTSECPCRQNRVFAYTHRMQDHVGKNGGTAHRCCYAGWTLCSSSCSSDLIVSSAWQRFR